METRAALPKPYQEYFLVSDRTKQRLFCVKFKPEAGQTPVGLVFIVHGYAEHTGPYYELAGKLARRGFIVSMHDHLGHGKSDGPRAIVDSITTYVRDLEQVASVVKDAHPVVLPKFLIGHSMGGTISLLAVLDNPGFWDGLILVAPAVILDADLVGPWRIGIIKLLNTIFPSCPVGKLRTDFITQDPERQAEIQDDDYRYHGMTKAGWAHAMLVAFKEIRTRIKELTLPLLIQHGDKDRLCALKGSQMVLEESSSKDKELKIYPEAVHGLFMEIEDVRQKTMADIEEWLLKQVDLVSNRNIE